ncbi:glycine--tRNA ligase subunit beta [Sphingomicrobium astaxanthinifaciens]|uniref:glycine--tRNA ligase subunit beta n=1 Tax=Sphingomicrobium astaxanthinifaciens TaxID=1227949 RepID=UPI001FCB6287|nr:glycine--tRNA ligase subunit beta [Sphingomicrobium astaxanthinifaciens]MCJ7422063.1 glycine--tRNA ligase subunit beta [Sphingomicrobium astaxanthinifaciens]
MTDFLLELFSEEIPARMQAKARMDLERLFTAQLAEAGLEADSIRTYSTPRRLALIASGLPGETEAVREETKGPPTAAPEQAVEGFLRKVGLTKDQLEVRDVKGRETYFAVVDKPGQPTADILGPAIANIVRDFPWPKSMRWGAASGAEGALRWVRPLHRIVALLGEDIVPVDVEGVTCGAASLGHRFHHPHEITFGGAHDYVEKLRMAHVLVDHEEREAIVRDGAKKAAAAAGYTLIEDEGLVIENAGLTEWPVPLLGNFDPDFLDVPEEVIQLTARTDQKYFVMRDGEGRLAPAFICTANIESSDPQAVVDGNQRVLAARLSDARFFWENDLKASLGDLARDLNRSVFFEGLGSYAEKAERIAVLAGKVATHVDGVDPHEAEEAARLAKADLTSGTVGEFPELQGVIGGYLARDLSSEQAEAIAYQYRDDPPGKLAQVVGLADRLDTLVAFFAKGQKPTGSKDPFALRRAALHSIKIITDNDLRVPLSKAFEEAAKGVPGAELDGEELLAFFADRLKVQQREAGVRHDLIDAVFALGGEDDLVRLLARVKALQAFVETEAGGDLLAAYKRAANILKKEGVEGSGAIPGSVEQTGEEDPLALVGESAGFDHAVAQWDHETLAGEEAALADALVKAGPVAAQALEEEDFTTAMEALASLRGPIDAFFDKVTVNSEVPEERARRLGLLARFRSLADSIADFGRIEG